MCIPVITFLSKSSLDVQVLGLNADQALCKNWVEDRSLSKTLRWTGVRRQLKRGYVPAGRDLNASVLQPLSVLAVHIHRTPTARKHWTHHNLLQNPAARENSP